MSQGKVLYALGEEAERRRLDISQNIFFKLTLAHQAKKQPKLCQQQTMHRCRRSWEAASAAESALSTQELQLTLREKESAAFEAAAVSNKSAALGRQTLAERFPTELST